MNKRFKRGLSNIAVLAGFRDGLSQVLAIEKGEPTDGIHLHVSTKARCSFNHYVHVCC